MRAAVNSLRRRASGLPARRLAPGERPCWWNALADRGAWSRWCAEADAHRVPVDVWVALLLELSFVRHDLAGAGIEDPLALMERLDQEANMEPRLALSPELREWVQMLAAGVSSQ